MVSDEKVSPIAVLESACASTGAVLGRVRPDRLDGATPCSEWRVRDLIDHLVGAVTFFGDLAESGSSPEDEEWPVYSNGDFSALFNEQARRTVAAFAAPGAMTRIMALPTGPTPGAGVIEVATGEIFVHGWDLARAVGKPLPPGEDEVAAALLASGWPALCDQVRSGEALVIAPPVAVAATASPVDRLVAHLGRDPNWPGG